MSRSLTHRGPDAEGTFVDDNGLLAFGHRRLKVLDLSENGAQPMSSPDGQVHLCYNGEVYNFLELRKELEASGYRFRSQTDTEVVLAAYQQYGWDFVERLNGDFAFALYDKRSETLRLYRDRIGIRPLYYFEANGVFGFASEIKALLEHPAAPHAPNLDRLREYIGHLYICGEETLFQGIYEVQPGSYVEVRNGRVRTGRYHLFSYDPEVRRMTANERRERFVELLDDSIRLRQISDVPLGLYLSGGVDSSYLACRMRAADADADIHSYSLGFEYGDYNEFPYSRQASTTAATTHREFIVRESEFFDVIDKVLRHYDEPVPHLVAIPQYYLAREAKPNITVALSGTGGDELLAGYSHYFAAMKLHEGTLDLSRADRDVAAYQQGLKPEQIASEFKSCSQMWLVDKIIPGEDYRDSVARHFREGGYPDFLSNMLYMDLKSHVVHMMNKEDKMNMAFGVEGRFPYFDYRLVQFALSLPLEDKIHKTTTKALLKKLAESYFPKRFLHREKQAFPTPVERWFAKDKRHLRFPVLRKQLSDQLNFNVIDELAKQHSESNRQHTRRLWGLYCLDVWFRQHFYS